MGEQKNDTAIRGRPGPEEVSQPLVERLFQETAVRDHPLFVGLDGRSGAGKSTVAATVKKLLAASGSAVTVIEGDDFYAGGSAQTWDQRTPPQRADRVIDWRRQRAVLERLRNRGEAEFRAFDWEADGWDSDEVPFGRSPVLCRVAPVVILEGAYSCRPELWGLLDMRALLEVPRDIRRHQLLEREGAGFRRDWEARWSEAEDYYFSAVMPPQSFDIILGAS